MPYTLEQANALATTARNAPGATGVQTSLPGTVPNSELKPETPLTIPPPTPATDLSASLLSSAQATADQSTGEENKGLSSITDLLGSLSGEAVDRANLETENKIPEQTQEYRDLQAVQSHQTADYINSLNNINKNSGTVEIASAKQAELNRSHGIDALLTSASLQAKAGNIEFSKSLVDKAISAKYDPIKAKIETQKFILDQIKTKAAQDRKNVLDLKLKELDKKMEDDKSIQGMLMEASALQAPTDVLAKANQIISSGGKPSDVAQVLGKYSQTYWTNQKTKADLDLTRANTAKAYADAKKTQLEAKQASGNGSLADYTSTTTTGKQYIDISKISDKKLAASVEATARSLGIPTLNVNEADQITNIEVARNNADAILSVVKDIAPTGALDRLVTGPKNLLSAFFQTNTETASFKSWRSAAIEAMRAMAGSKGLRINKNEIELATENDIPKITDTLDVANKKIENLKTQLNSWENVLTNGKANINSQTPQEGTLSSGVTWKIIKTP